MNCKGEDSNEIIDITDVKRFEAENGTLIGGVSVATAISGYSGYGYVTGFTDQGGYVMIPVNVEAGLYTLTIGYHSGFGDKGYDLVVNGEKSSGTFTLTNATWGTTANKTFLLQKGLNNITIGKGWGYYEVDYVDVTRVIIPATRFEAENGTLIGGVSVATDIPGYSGWGYVTGFTDQGGYVTIPATVEAGLYELTIGYHSGFGDKGFDIEVNGEKSSATFVNTNKTWGTTKAGKFLLQKGWNNITIGKGWGYYEVDYVDVNPASVHPPVKPPNKLSDPNATPSTHSLLSFLIDNYGSKVLTGQYGMTNIEYVHNVTGKSPAVGGFDLINYSPSRVEHGANATGSVENWTKWALAGNGLVTLCWHWNAPCDLIDKPGKEWWRGFYTYATTYNISFALSNTSSVEYVKLIRDLDAIAIQIQKFQDKNTPLLWRPLHEASGGWFWWGAEGPAPFIQLWRLMYKRFVNVHNLHHLIWVYTADPDHHEWYPGSDVVDIVGMDIYTDPSSSMSVQWDKIQEIYNGKKLVTLAETGTLPVPSKVRGYQVWWSWFSEWQSMITNITDSHIRSVYNDNDMLTLDLLPDWRHYKVLH